MLENINSPLDLKKLSIEELPLLSKELREFILNIVSTKEGHLGASLGVIELTLAVHYVFDTPNDKLIWDVGHQAYAHKIITGRRNSFCNNRQKGGISGFPKISESKYDAFGTGHSSTSISAILGMALACKLKGEKKHHIAVIGDASIASGMAFEGLNNMGVSDLNTLVILNDNAIAIDPYTGALKNHLSDIKRGINEGKNIFENLNFKYFGPVDGHDIRGLIKVLEEVKMHEGAKFLHVITVKGKGYKNAENDQVRFHAPGKFDLKTGIAKVSENNNLTKYQEVFGNTIVELADEDDRIIGITPAMVSGSSLQYMMRKYPSRTFDVGISEQHAITFAAGMASQGLKPIVVIYSTFLQRAYDQIVHDVAIQKLPVIFCIDRAGIVGEDGATHHGIFDIAWLRTIPNVIVSAPINEAELRNLMFLATNSNMPFFIRYPRGFGVLGRWKNTVKKINIGQGNLLKTGSDIAILSIGSIGNFVVDAIDGLTPKNIDKVAHYDMIFIKPLDVSLLTHIFDNYKVIITVEDGVKKGGFGTAILEWANDNNKHNKVKILAIGDSFLNHATTNQLYDEIGISTNKITNTIISEIAEI